jgi:hypothetical protein
VDATARLDHGGVDGLGFALIARVRLAWSSIVATLALSGCVLHFGDDTECDTGEGPPPPSSDLLINPATLECDRFAGASTCNGFDPNTPTWGSCESSCRSLGEGTCQATPGCRGAYDHDCLFGTGPCPALTPFIGCFPTDRNQDFVTGCEGLDAWNCSRHESCIATHRTTNLCRDGLDQNGDGTIDDAAECLLEFVRCLPEDTVGPF